MNTILSGNIYTDNLSVGQQLTVTTDSSGTALVDRFLGDQFIDTTSLPSGTTKIFGDYTRDINFKISCLSGTLTINKSISLTPDEIKNNLTGAIISNGTLTSLGSFSITELNSALGYNLANFVGTNVFLAKSGNNTVTGDQNTGIGTDSQKNLTTGSYNTGVGINSQLNLTTGTQNTGIGTGSQKNLTTGSYNTGIGTNSQLNLTTGTHNTGIGTSSQFNLTTGGNNTGVGANSQFNLGTTQTAGNFVVGIVYTIKTIGTTDFTLIGAASNTIGIVFTATGVGAGTGTASPNVNNNTALGYNTGLGIIHGNGNTILGASVGGLAAGLLNNIILASGAGSIKAQHDGTNWALTGKIVGTSTIRTAGYTVATLPVGTLGDIAYVTDATTPAYLSPVVGGGAVKAPVFYNGTGWVFH